MYIYAHMYVDIIARVGSFMLHMQWREVILVRVYIHNNINLIKNSQAVKKGAAPIKAMVKKDVKSKVAAKKWL